MEESGTRLSSAVVKAIVLWRKPEMLHKMIKSMVLHKFRADQSRGSQPGSSGVQDAKASSYVSQLDSYPWISIVMEWASVRGFENEQMLSMHCSGVGLRTSTESC